MKIKEIINPIYLRFYPYFKKYVRLILLCMAFAAVVSAASASLPWFLKQIIDELFIRKEFQHLLPIMIALAVLVIVLNVFVFLQEYFMEKVKLRLSMHLRKKMIESIFTKKMSFFKKKHSGELVSLFNYDLAMAEGMPEHLARLCFEYPVQLIMLFAAMLYLNAKLAMFVLLVAPPSYLILRLSKKYRRVLSHRRMLVYGKIYAEFQEYLAGIKIIKGWNLGRYCKDKFIGNFEYFTRQTLREVQYASAIRGALELLAVLIINVILYLAVSDIRSERATPGDYAGFIMAAWLFLQPLKKIGVAYSSLINSQVAAERILEVLEDNDFNESHLQEGLPVPSIASIEIQDAAYGYDSNRLLTEVNMTFEPSKIHFILGANGSGKTTLVESLLGFVEPEEGRILINGLPMNRYSISALRERISFLSQDVFLFNSTVRENILFGEAFPDEAVKAQYQKALSHARVDQLLDAHGRDDTGLLAERGSNFSGGEKQCIALARALFKDHDVLILDEANSSVSKDIFMKILQTLREEKQGKIIIFITHDSAYHPFADVIYEISDQHVLRKRI